MSQPRRCRRSVSSVRSSFRPSLEELETRLAAAVDFWVATAPGNWSTGANWSLTHAPTTGDVATFDSTHSQFAANIDTNIDVGGISIAGYTGTITQLSGSG